MNKSLIAICLLLASALPVSAYHIQQWPGGPGNGVWIGAENQRILCESNGWWDSVNFDPIPRSGVGGNCYYWLTSVAPGLAGDASFPADTCTQATLAGAVFAFELTPGCQTYTYKPKPAIQLWWCLTNILTAQLLPVVPGLGGEVPTTWRVGSFQMQGDSKGMCFEESYAWWMGSHIAAFPAMAWSEPRLKSSGLPSGVTGVGNVPGATGVVAAWLGPVTNLQLPVWCTFNGNNPAVYYPPSPLCVDEATVDASLYI